MFPQNGHILDQDIFSCMKGLVIVVPLDEGRGLSHQVMNDKKTNNQ